jgi:cytochrome c peroxidase
MKKTTLCRNNFLTLIVSVVCLTILLMSACTKKEDGLVMTGNGGATTPNLPATPYNYHVFMGDNLATLGRVLFYDRNLSLNNSISCASCHVQAHAFADNHTFSVGLNNGYTARNASALFGDQSHNHFWDGRAANYDTAVFMPVMNHTEMDVFDVNLLPGKLSSQPYYGPLFTTAYGTPDITAVKIRQALATFTSAIVSVNSPFDNQWNGSPLTITEQQGWTLFTGKAKCYNCHSGNNFNGYFSDYENIGLDVSYADIGRGRITKTPSDNGKFQVPTLRNIALTAPYMHDGRFKTLREVIDHYSEGIQNSPNLSSVFRDIPIPQTEGVLYDPSAYPVLPLRLTEDEKKALEAFLNTLTDVSLVADPKFSSPFFK